MDMNDGFRNSIQALGSSLIAALLTKLKALGCRLDMYAFPDTEAPHGNVSASVPLEDVAGKDITQILSELAEGTYRFAFNDPTTFESRDIREQIAERMALMAERYVLGLIGDRDPSTLTLVVRPQPAFKTEKVDATSFVDSDSGLSFRLEVEKVDDEEKKVDDEEKYYLTMGILCAVG